MLDIDDKYTAYCFDEACAFIISKLKDGEKPILNRNKREQGGAVKRYNRFSDLYDKYKMGGE